MALALEQIDVLLTDWKQTIDRASQNLIDLYGLITYQRLTGEAGFPKVELTGVTKERVAPALTAMHDLFQHFDLLTQVINQAIALRKQVPRFLGAEQKVQEIEQLVLGQSIQLPVVQIPLAQRSLLSVTQTATAISPKNLLAAMMNAFEEAKAVVLAVDDAWTRLEPKLAEAEAEVRSLLVLATSLGVDQPLELAAAQQAIAPLREQIERDPLGVAVGFDQRILPMIAQVRSTLGTAARERQQVQTSLDSAHLVLNRLEEVNQQAIAAFAERQEKVVDLSPSPTPLAHAQIDAMRHWLTRLETKLVEGSCNPVSIGLKNWHAKAEQYLAAETAAIATHRRPVQTRQELRGRIDALKAKALARGLIEDTMLSDLADRAKQLLYARPTPLDQAAECVRQYERRLNSHGE